MGQWDSGQGRSDEHELLFLGNEWTVVLDDWMNAVWPPEAVPSSAKMAAE